MKYIFLAVIFMGHLTGAGYVPPKDQKQREVDFCVLVSNPGDFDQKGVLTRAIMSAGDHSVIAYDQKCMPTPKNNVSTEIEISDSAIPKHLLKKLYKFFKHRKNADVVFVGVFKGTGGPYGADGARFRFIVEKLLAVHESKGAVLSQ
jgi:hypothetical protein